MKLLLCVECSDVFSLRHFSRSCHCGLISGEYVDDVNAEVTGNPIVLGFNNQSFVHAIRTQITYGDSTKMMNYPGGKVVEGHKFEAFIIPESADSVMRIDKKD